MSSGLSRLEGSGDLIVTSYPRVGGFPDDPVLTGGDDPQRRLLVRHDPVHMVPLQVPAPFDVSRESDNLSVLCVQLSEPIESHPAAHHNKVQAKAPGLRSKFFNTPPTWPSPADESKVSLHATTLDEALGGP